MGTIFANAPIQPTVIEVQVGKIYFDAICKYCGKRATTNVRPIDHIGRQQGSIDVCGSHAEQLIQRARAKGMEVSIRE
jgi:hypothetical protein